MSKKQRNILIGIGIFFLLGFIGSFIPDEKEEAAPPPAEETQTQEEQPAPVETPAVEEPLPAPVVNILDIAGKTEAEVAAVLGQPTERVDGTWRYKNTEERVPNCPTCYYKDGLIEIKYIEGPAAWITINPKNISIDDDAAILNLFGLQEKRPTYNNDNGREVRKEWTMYGDLYKIAAFTNTEDKNITCAYIITNIKYE